MQRFLFFFIFLLFQSSAIAQQSDTETVSSSNPSKVEKTEEQIECRFIGKVRWVEMAGRWKGEPVPIGVDPKWLVAVKIESIEKPFEPFVGKVVVLLVRSPTRLLGVWVNDTDSRFKFTITGVLRDGDPHCTSAKAEKCAEAAEAESRSNRESKRRNETDDLVLEAFKLQILERQFMDMVALDHTEYPQAIRAVAADRLRKSDSRNPLLLEFCDDENPTVRASALNALALKTYLDDKAETCPKKLIEALFDEDRRVRETVLNYVGIFEKFPQDSLPLFMKALQHQDNSVRQLVAGNFYRLGDDAKIGIPLLQKMLEDEVPLVRHNATVSLWYLTYRPEMILRTNLELASIASTAREGDEDIQFLEIASAVFFKIVAEESPKEVGSELLVLLEDRSPAIRASAVRLLGAMADTDKVIRSLLLELKAEERLQKMLEDEDEKVRRYAENSLEKLSKTP